MSDEFAETDEWPTPEGWMRHQAETGLVPPRNATHRPSGDRVVWRDRGARIAALEAENVQLRATVANVEKLLGPASQPIWGGEPDGYLVRMSDLLAALNEGDQS